MGPSNGQTSWCQALEIDCWPISGVSRIEPRGTTADRSGVVWERRVCALCSDRPGFGNGAASDMKMKHSTKGRVAIIAVGTVGTSEKTQPRDSIAPRRISRSTS